MLLMALLRGVGISCQVHGFAIDKKLQKGAQTGLVYYLAPKEIIHSWGGSFYQGRWLDLKGVILDEPYLQAVQKHFHHCAKPFCGYGIAVDDLQAVKVDWTGESTYIQSKYNSPDDFLGYTGKIYRRLKYGYTSILDGNG